jgi:hypothetical protein
MMGVFVQTNESSMYGKRSPIGYVIEENGCWTWVGATSSAGHGTVRWKGTTTSAHRMMYEANIGPIPEGAVLDHFRCNNPSCVNPEHVRPASYRENNLRCDSVVAKNAAKETCPMGHPLSGDNLSRYELSKGKRLCRQCKNAGQVKWATRAKERGGV